MYKAIEMEREFRDKLALNAKFFLMDIINKRMALGLEEPSEDGFYTIDTNDFKRKAPRIEVLEGNTYDEEMYPESRIVTKIHLDEDIYITCKADPEYDDDDEVELTFKYLPFEQMIGILCALEDYTNEIDVE